MPARAMALGRKPVAETADPGRRGGSAEAGLEGAIRTTFHARASSRTRREPRPSGWIGIWNDDAAGMAGDSGGGYSVSLRPAKVVPRHFGGRSERRNDRDIMPRVADELNK